MSQVAPRTGRHDGLGSLMSGMGKKPKSHSESNWLALGSGTDIGASDKLPE